MQSYVTAMTDAYYFNRKIDQYKFLFRFLAWHDILESVGPEKKFWFVV